MNRITQLLFVVIALMVSGCSKQSQVQSATTSKPSAVQAAAPAVPGAPQPATDTASKSGLLTPQPSAGQHVDDRAYLISSDQNYTVGAQIVTGSGEMLFTRLAVKNQTASPAFVDLKDVTIDAPGRKVVVVRRETLATMLGSNSGTQGVLKKLLSDYWDNRTVLPPGSQGEHFLLAVCGKGCPMPVSVHVAVGGQPHDFTFGDVSNAPASEAAEVSSQPVVPSPQVAIAGRWVRELCSGNENDPQMGISVWQRVQFVGTPESYAMLVFETYTRARGNDKLKSATVWNSNAEMSSRQDAWTLEDPSKNDNLLVIQRGSTLGSKLLVAGKPTPFLMGVEALKYSVFLPDDGLQLENYPDGCFALHGREFR
jgi:hypothetical protein